MAEYQCGFCGYVFKDADTMMFSNLEETWKCPVCSAAKSQFSRVAVPVPEEVYLGRSVVDEIHFMAQ